MTIYYNKDKEELGVACPKCGSSMMWEDCDQCDEGYSHHDCGEDTCCCLDPYDNVTCDTCGGTGGIYVCVSCETRVPTNELKEKVVVRKSP